MLKRKIFSTLIGLFWVLGLAFLGGADAQAQELQRKALVDYWYKTMIIEGKVQNIDIQPAQLAELNGKAPDWQKINLSLVKAKNELQSIQVDPSLADELSSIQAKQVKGIEYSINIIQGLADFSTSKDPLKLFATLKNIQEAGKIQREANLELIKLSEKYLSSGLPLSKKEALVAYWTKTKVSELSLMQVMDDLTRFTLDIMEQIQDNPGKMGTNSGEIQQKVLSLYTDLEKQLKVIESDLKQVKLEQILASDLQPIHQMKIKGVKLTVELLRTVNQVLQKGDNSLPANLSQQSKEISLEMQNYNKAFYNLIEKYSRLP